ncbi:hypothetical protein GCM10018965_082270 [Nonomuraea roseola]
MELSQARESHRHQQLKGAPLRWPSSASEGSCQPPYDDPSLRQGAAHYWEEPCLALVPAEKRKPAAAPLPVLGPGGPALRVSLPLNMRAEDRCPIGIATTVLDDCAAGHDVRYALGDTPVTAADLGKLSTRRVE